METLIQRLVANPHDEEALAYAHRAGTADPRSYAILLEKVGQATADPAYAAHWLSEAANVWSTTIGDAHHAARTLMIAIDKDPTGRTAPERLAQLYRDKGDLMALVALLERLVKAWAPLLNERPDLLPQLVSMHEELGRLWSDPAVGRPERSLENWRRVAELDPQNVYAIYAAREMLKAAQQWAEAVPYFAMEQAVVDDPERKLALYRDEADVQKRAGDRPGATHALRNARQLLPDDIALKQELGVSILERIEFGENVSAPERDEAAQIFVSLAETYDGAYGLSYSVSALKAEPENDRAMQLADFYAGQLNRTVEIGPQYAAYLQVNPNGFMAEAARAKVGNARPPAPPAPPIPPSRSSAPAGEYEAVRHRAASEEHRPSSAGSNPGMPAVRPTPAPFQSPTAPFQSPTAPFQSPVASSSSGSFQATRATPVPSATPSQVAREAQAAAAHLGDLQQILDEAQAESQKGRKPQAYAKFREALKIDPAQSEALSWVEDYLRQKRMFADLRDVLLAAARVPTVSPETRKAQLRDVAGICESQLRDMETAIQTWKQLCQIDRGDEQAREQLRRLLEKSARWDDLAMLLEQETMGTPDVEEKIALEKKLATLHEQKRKDPAAAAEAWARIANLAPQDEAAIHTAVKLYEKGERYDLAAQVLSDTVQNLEDKAVKGTLLQKLGELRLKIQDAGGAGDAYAEAAELSSQPKTWELAEKAYLGANRFADAALAVERRAESLDGKQKAVLLAQAADLLLKAQDPAAAIARLEQAAEIDPQNDLYAQTLEEQYRKESREIDLVRFFLARAEKVSDKARRVGARHAAAALQRVLGDREGARESLLAVLADGDEVGALGQLVDDALERGDHQEAADFLHRLGGLATTPQQKIDIALREAALLAGPLDDVEGALARYEAVVKDIGALAQAGTPSLEAHRLALRAIAGLHDKRGDQQGVAAALERELELLTGNEGEERVAIAQRLAQLYEGPLADPRAAIRVLDIVHAADAEDFDAIARLQQLNEQVEDWPRVATLMASLIEVEGDEEEASRLTVRLAGILADKLHRGDEALSALEKLADGGDAPSRDAYVALGDALGWKGIVATKLVAWHESGMGPARNDALRSAFVRFLEIGRDQDAARVAMEIARARAADHAMAAKLEELATRLRDLDALAVAHDLLGKELSGAARAAELVRQAEVQVAAGIDPLEAMQHGESGLSSVPPSEVEPLLGRLAALTQAPGHVIDLYERQVGRCRVPADRLAALARAAQVAAERGAADRARSFFELALGGGIQEDTLVALEAAARLGDEKAGGVGLRTTLAEALAAGGQGSRDGGRTRGALLRRAATLAHRDLGDVDRAFGWLGDALITHVEDASLEALEALGREIGALPRVEATLSRALEEVFDGPLVRKLLQRRARLRRDVLGDKKGAAVDLKKLHDLSPSDLDVMNELSTLLLELGDHRGMIQLYEDQILRGRDPAQRAELARKVAHLWEEELGDAREAADAWRRVLRMKAGDPEATSGLERAKTGKLKHAAHKPAAAPSEAPKPAVAPSEAPKPAAAPSEASSPAVTAEAHPPVSAPAPSAPAPISDDFERTAVEPPQGLADAEAALHAGMEAPPAPSQPSGELHSGDLKTDPDIQTLSYVASPEVAPAQAQLEQVGQVPQQGFAPPQHVGYVPETRDQEEAPSYVPHGYHQPGYVQPSAFVQGHQASTSSSSSVSPGASEDNDDEVAEVDDAELLDDDSSGAHHMLSPK